MLDNQLIALIISTLENGLTAIGQGGYTIAQNYQPTQQGTPTGPSVFLYKIGPDVRIGQPTRSGQQGAGSASFTGSITGSILTVTAVASGALAVNQGLVGAGISTNLIILSQIDGTIGAEGTYQINQAPAAPVPSEAISSIGTWVYTEDQQYSTTFQASALSTQDPADTNQLTASDILNYVAAVLQSQTAIDTFENNNVGILRIDQIRNPYFSDDRERYEASPSFDFTLTHHQIVITSIPVVTSYSFEIDRV